MGHPGEKRLTETLKQCYHHSTLLHHIEKFKCKDCQTYKVLGHWCGLLPKKEMCVACWEEVTINLIGPWVVNINDRQLEFNALTCLDTASNLIKLIRIANKTTTHVCDKFTQCWLCQYPWPLCCVHDKGGNFIGRSYQWLLEMFSIKDVCLTSKNLQSNAICERMHLGKVPWILVHINPPQIMTQARDIMDDNHNACHVHHCCYYPG
jgi:hypothetical protein